MLISNLFFEKLINGFRNKKFDTKIIIVNKIIKLILQTSSIFTLLSIFIIIKEYNYTFGDEDFTILDIIYIIIVYLAFYLIIFAVLPVWGILGLIYILNKKYNIEIIKIKIHFRLLAINIILTILTILTGYFYYKSRFQY